MPPKVLTAFRYDWHINSQIFLISARIKHRPIVSTVDAPHDGSHPRVQFFLHPCESILMCRFTGEISCFHRVIDKVVQLVLPAVDSVKFPGPIVPCGVASGRVFGKLREFVDVLSYTMSIVRQRCLGLLFFP